MLGRMAADAGEMELGTAIYVLPLQHPVEVAENFATRDALTPGRLIFGVAMGYRDVEFDALCVPIAERAARFEEGVRLIMRLWTEDDVTSDGRFYPVRNATLAMRPVRQPRPPIWIGATAESAIARAARLGDAWMLGPRVRLAELPKQLGVYRDARRAAGRSLDGDYPTFREVVVRSSDGEARGAATAVQTKYAAYARWRYADTGFDDLVRDAFIVGAPDTCVAALEQYRAHGITHVLARFQTPSVAQADALAAIRLFGERVMPKLR